LLKSDGATVIGWMAGRNAAEKRIQQMGLDKVKKWENDEI
jgi:hypothetical protein